MSELFIYIIHCINYKCSFLYTVVNCKIMNVLRIIYRGKHAITYDPYMTIYIAYLIFNIVIWNLVIRVIL